MATTAESRSPRSPPDDVLTPPNSSILSFAVPVKPMASVPTLQIQPHFQTRTATAVRRPSPPPRNDHNELCCTHEDCQGSNISFKRLCEWNKHMDRHERPYKCEHPNCHNAQGFTYSGGLMRHQREVHRWHQTTKSRLFCPFPDCVRNASGEGFSRKENLEEHRRRRHPGRDLPNADPFDEDNQPKKRKRLVTPLPSDCSAKAETPDLDDDNDDTSVDVPNSVSTDEGMIVKRLRAELQQTREELQRVTNDNHLLRSQVLQYYTLLQNVPPQIYHVNHGAQAAHGLMPPPNGYAGADALAYSTLQGAYKK